MSRRRKLSDEDAADVRRLYFERAPNGRSYSMASLARMFRVSAGTIQHAVDRTGAYSVDEPESVDEIQREDPDMNIADKLAEAGFAYRSEDHPRLGKRNEVFHIEAQMSLGIMRAEQAEALADRVLQNRDTPRTIAVFDVLAYLGDEGKDEPMVGGMNSTLYHVQLWREGWRKSRRPFVDQRRAWRLAAEAEERAFDILWNYIDEVA